MGLKFDSTKVKSALNRLEFYLEDFSKYDSDYCSNIGERFLSIKSFGSIECIPLGDGSFSFSMVPSGELQKILDEAKEHYTANIETWNKSQI